MDQLLTRLATLASNLQLTVLRQTLANLHDCAARNGAVDSNDIEFFLRSQINDWAPTRQATAGEDEG